MKSTLSATPEHNPNTASLTWRETMVQLRKAYAHIEPYAYQCFAAGRHHEVYAEQCGVAKAPTAVVLHGGPGGGCTPAMRRFFHPGRWRTILFDQRGCGRSRPLSSLEDNTTWRLVEDMEMLRRNLGVETWTLFGGSWGATLAVAYAEAYPERVDALILRAVFLISQEEIDWFYGGGAGQILPDQWADFVGHLPVEERDTPVASYYARLTSDDEAVRQAAVLAWTAWENAAIRIGDRGTDRRMHISGRGRPARMRDPAALDALARLECHYCHHGGFMERPNQLLEDATRLDGIPGVIVQGRYDVVTPPVTAWRLAQTWTDAELIYVEGAGHAASDPAIVDALVRATDTFAAQMR